MKIIRRIFVVFATCLCSLRLLAASEPLDELAVLIDVSGSMKQSDPKNMRVGALRLLLGLVPNGMSTGVWTFATDSQALFLNAKITADNRDSALKLAAKIHSKGTHTNIESAIDSATKSWLNEDSVHNRHLLLLTDGMIDLSKNADENLASRLRIIESWLPKLRQAKIKIHTIALSPNADHALLKLMARETNGWYEQTDNADRLNRVFLRLFESTTATDKVPLKENSFVIDKSISDMTLLIFKPTGSSPPQLLGPNNQRWSALKKPANIRWYSQEGYDLVTVPAPTPGSWKLLASQDNDNRVMVVTNLQLKSTTLAKHVLPGDKLQLNAWLEQNNVKVTQTEFLKLVRFSASANPLVTNANLSTQKDTAIFTAQTIKKQGIVSLQITAQSHTFERVLTHTVQVHADPVRIILQKRDELAQSLLQATAVPELFDENSLTLVLKFNDNYSLPLKKNALNVHEILIPSKYNGQSASLIAQGIRVSKEPFRFTLETLLPTYPKLDTLNNTRVESKPISTQPSAIAINIAANNTAQTLSQTPAAQNEQTDELIKKQKRKKKNEAKLIQPMLAAVDWNRVIVGVIAGNVLFILIGILVFYRAKKRATNLNAILESDTGGST